MTDKNIDAQEIQHTIATKLNAITIKRLAIESMQEQISEAIDDLVSIYKDSYDPKSKADVKLLVDTYVDAEQAKKDRQVKIDKSKQDLNKIETFEEELSVFDRFRLENAHDEADKLLGKG